ncbi:peptidoglycan DD-metalloendopeptidase family protein [Notoacmeibacter sp. MSK16QG-6]|uniref:peptidoglycan DD-metalloendopeptidase family protein n=1 Tax=Notoacmeibacter sp. MSK16QG-6 TaxID=2957982 RepID=UPI00209E4E6F|nr:peptidoglycan DD-metalloendopeptidase family protein [Notoacmeibacter sp. MSK16QG-6]MCP1199384.1 peptidoglycan DD-metalloendopeptidase family protein [Notoacmeibacter sp. MSK16QG-6]
MRSDVSTARRNYLGQGKGAALLLVAGLLAGCSTDALRLGQDGFYASAVPQSANVDTISTGSVGNQITGTSGPVRPQQDVGAGGSQVYASAPVYQNAPAASYPGSARAPVYDRRQLNGGGASASAGAPLLAPPSNAADRVTTGSVRSEVISAPLAPASSSTPARTATAATSQPMPKRVEGGWSGQGTRVTLGDGETVYSISRRYGVPVDAIKQANGLNDASAVRAGQTLVIPSFGQSAAASPTKADPESASMPAKVTSGSSEGTYKVVAGDTLAGIARRAGTSVSALKAANRMSDDNIRIGQTLSLPGRQVASASGNMASRSVDPIATGPVAAKHAESAKSSKALPSYEKPKADKAQTLAKAAEKTKDAPQSTGVSKLRWPAKGRVIRNFGGGSPGIDIAVPMGTPVKAAENGVVVYAGSGLKDLGNTVLVQHADGTTTVYGNASELSVKKGDKVARGQQIARAGTTGNASAPQVHFEVRKKSNPVDPKKWLE